MSVDLKRLLSIDLSYPGISFGYESWALESHALAVQDAYAHIPTDGPPPKLNEAYVTRGEQDVKQQLAKAGLRLAWTLNKIFD